MADVSTIANSGKNAIDSLIYGTCWSNHNISYSFTTSASDYPDYASDEYPSQNFKALSALQQTAAKQALAAWANVADISFSQTTGAAGTIRFGTTSGASTSLAYMPGSLGYGGDVWFGNSNGSSPDNPVVGSYDYSTFMHEIGHALGLKHPHEDGDIADSSIDCLAYTVMSYRSYPGAALTGYTVYDGSYPSTIMMDDIAAIQYIYGANYKYNSGNTVYKFSPTQSKYFETIWDGGGVDTYDLSAYTTNLKIDLRPGYWSLFDSRQLADLGNNMKAEGNLANALQYQNNEASLIENAIGGTGNDLLQGNQADNTLDAGAGNDTLVGAAGNDTLIGGAGADSMDGGDDSDQLWGGTGNDTMLGGSGSNGFWWGIGDGTDMVIQATGNTQDALLFYNVATSAYTAEKSGNDLVFTTAKGDLLTVKDWYSMSAAARLQNWVFEGTDFVWNDGKNATVNLADACYTMAAVHKAVAYDAGNNTLLGSSGNDTLSGGAYSNQLWGGAGDDVLLGGSGSNAFWWGSGDGHETIITQQSTQHDTMMLYNLSIDGFSAAQKNMDLNLQTADGSTACLENWFAQNPVTRIQSWVFTGNTAMVWNGGQAATVNLSDACYAGAVHTIFVRDTGNETLIGSTASDTITAGSGGSQIWSAAGNDSMAGGAGDDVFWWGQGDGQDTIAASSLSSHDCIKIYNHSIADLITTISGNDLMITIKNDVGDSLLVKNWAAGGGSQLTQFIAGDQMVHLSPDAKSWT